MLGDSGQELTEIISVEEVNVEILDSSGNLVRKDEFSSLTDDQIAFCTHKAQGKRAYQIREAMGIGQTTFRKYQNDPLCIKFIENLLADAVDASKNKIREAANMASDTLIALLDSHSDPVRLGAAKDILDRAGLKAPEKKEISGTLNLRAQTSELSDEEIYKRLKQIRGEE